MKSKATSMTPKTTTSTLLASVLLVPVMGLASWGSIPQEGGDRVDEVRATLENMVETRRVLSKERSDWKLGREMLEDRIEVVRSEIESLRTKLADVEGNIAEADRKRAELVSQKERYTEATATLVGIVNTLETRTLSLLPRLPDPIRERVKPLSQRIPADPANNKESLSARFQNVVGILDQVDKFNREITVGSEVRTLPGGTGAEVKALYVGIGQGYYVTAKGDSAGVGNATPEGWAWSPANEMAAVISRAIAIWKNEDGAAFVRLPISIQ